MGNISQLVERQAGVSWISRKNKRRHTAIETDDRFEGWSDFYFHMVVAAISFDVVDVE